MTRATPRRVPMIVGAIVLAVIASGCGGGSAKTSSAASTHDAPSASVDAGQTSSDATDDGSTETDAACQLLSEGDVTAAMQQPMKVAGGAGAAVCEYAATSDPSSLLALQLFDSGADVSMYTQLETSSEHIDGLGDDAFWNPTLDMVFVQRGARSFAVSSPSLANLTGDALGTKSAMVGLARIVLGKL